jgi:pimeloyl-ACP methyl ester carboxylesterase
MSQPDDARLTGVSATVPVAAPTKGESISERLQLLEVGAKPHAANAESAPPPRALAVGDIMGHYRVLGNLGSGGMGYIHRALDLQLEREVAIKVALESVASDADPMLREARALAALNHPNVVTVYEVGVHEGCAYIVMELLRGETLRARLDRARPTFVEALALACDVLRGLSTAHEARIVHLDVKPENVFLTKDGSVKLLDFGIARHKRTGVHERNEIVGTIAYMAPEQLLGDPLDFRADIFAFGILLHELATGQHPFSRANVAATMYALVNGEFFKDGAVADPEVEAIVRACMELEPSSRPPSAAHVLEDLERVLRARRQVVTPSGVAYVETEHGNVAFQSLGVARGVDLLVVPGLLSRFDAWSHEPEGAAFLRALTEVGRVILFDHAGCGASDRVADRSLPSPDDEVEHIDAVLDKVSASRVVLFALDTGAPLAALYAATRPERVAGLVLYAGAPRYTDAAAQALLSTRADGWGTEKNVALGAPSFAEEARSIQWISSWERVTASPKTVRAWVTMIGGIDVTAALPFITCPTLVLYREGDRCCAASQSVAFAEGISGAERVALPGADHLACAGPADVAPHVVRFSHACAAAARSDEARSLATWIVTDAPADIVPARLRPARALESGVRRIVRVDRPGAAERALRALFDSAGAEGKAVIACSARGTSPEEVLAEAEPLFAKARPGEVVATTVARTIIDGTVGPTLEAPQKPDPDIASTSRRAGAGAAAVEEVAPVLEKPPKSEAEPVSAARESQPEPKEPEKQSRLAILLVGAGLVAAAAISSFALDENKRDVKPPEAPPPAASMAVPTKNTYTLWLESRPVGATVKEGDKELGKTPIAITLDGHATEPRVFTLSLEGYVDDTFRQEPAMEDVRFVAALTKAEAAPAPSLSATSEPAASAGKRPKVESHRSTPAVQTAVPAASDPPRSSSTLDLRLNR